MLAERAGREYVLAERAGREYMLAERAGREYMLAERAGPENIYLREQDLEYMLAKRERSTQHISSGPQNINKLCYMLQRWTR